MNYYTSMYILYSMIRDLEIIEGFNKEREGEVRSEYESLALEEYAQEECYF